MLEGDNCRVVTCVNSAQFNLIEGEFRSGLADGWCRTVCTDKAVNDEIFEGTFVRGSQRGAGILVQPFFNEIREG